jgi:hypothetical protein
MLVLKDHEGGQMVRRNFKPEQIIKLLRIVAIN